MGRWWAMGRNESRRSRLPFRGVPRELAARGGGALDDAGRTAEAAEARRVRAWASAFMTGFATSSLLMAIMTRLPATIIRFGRVGGRDDAPGKGGHSPGWRLDEIDSRRLKSAVCLWLASSISRGLAADIVDVEARLRLRFSGQGGAEAFARDHRLPDR